MVFILIPFGLLSLFLGGAIYLLLKRLKRSKKLYQSIQGELKLQSAKIQELNNELNALSYSVSHDLRAPLRAINGFSRILQKEFSNRLDEEGNEFLSIIYESTQKMNTLIEDLLMFSRLGRKDMEFTSIDLNQGFNNIFQEIITKESERNVKLNLSQLPLVYGDRSMIEQFVFCLLSNAVKFSRCRTSAIIEVACQTKDRIATCYIKDNGIGLDMDYANKIFTLFQKLHKPEEYEGNGSGLAFAKRIINRHGGSISVESDINQGATFNFSLPCP